MDSAKEKVLRETREKASGGRHHDSLKAARSAEIGKYFKKIGMGAQRERESELKRATEETRKCRRRI